MRLVVASANPDKVAEIAAILEPAGVELEPRPASVPDVVEDADTLEGNARLKAVAIADAVGAAAVADDTGLEVDALGGAPGVHSARFAGEDATYADNVAKLLAELDRVGAADARAAAGPVPHGGAGALARRHRGGRSRAPSRATSPSRPRGSGGFGYDPVFVPDEGGGRTFAEMSRGREARHQPSGPGLPRPGGDALAEGRDDSSPAG